MELDDFKNILIPFDNSEDTFTLFHKDWSGIINTISCFANNSKEAHLKILSRFSSKSFLSLYEKDFFSLPLTFKCEEFIVEARAATKDSVIYAINGIYDGNIEEINMFDTTFKFFSFQKNSYIKKRIEEMKI